MSTENTHGKVIGWQLQEKSEAGQLGQRGDEAVQVQPERNERQPSLSQRAKVSIKGACDCGAFFISQQWSAGLSGELAELCHWPN